MADITITITADEDALRSVAADLADRYSCHAGVVRDAIAAALPKPRIVVKPGMVLRRNSDGVRAFSYSDIKGGWLWLEHGGYLRDDVDLADWTVILDAEDQCSTS